MTKNSSFLEILNTPHPVSPNRSGSFDTIISYKTPSGCWFNSSFNQDPDRITFEMLDYQL